LNTDAYWTIVCFFGVWIGLWLPIAIAVSRTVGWSPPQPLTPAQKLPLLASLYALAPLVFWGFCRLRQDSLQRYGLAFAPDLGISLGWGLLGGILGLGSMVLMQQRLGWLQWNEYPVVVELSTEQSNASTPIQGSTATPPVATRFQASVLPTVLTTLFLGLWVGFTEELIFRGLIQTQLELSLASWQSALLTSALFALLHLVWEGRANLPQLPGLWLMGLVLTLARWVDQGSLGLPWGLHAGWIWLMASLDTLQAVRYTHRVSPWLTGWEGKPLAGAVGIGFLLLTAGALWLVRGLS
jgi:membrane protease YdiL (CAAX protease family)